MRDRSKRANARVAFATTVVLGISALMARANEDAQSEFQNIFSYIQQYCDIVVECNKTLWAIHSNQAADNYDSHLLTAQGMGCSFTSGNPGDPDCQNELYNVEYWYYMYSACDAQYLMWASS